MEGFLLTLDLRVLAFIGVALSAPAWADDAEDPLSPYRTPFPVLTERVLGTTSRPVEFDWRRGKVQVGGGVRQLAELNNFNSLGAGVVARFPTNGMVFETTVEWVEVWDTPSSELLALTPYRQPGRPARVDLDFALGIPVAEGIVTAARRWFPPMQLVFLGYVGLRYSVFPGAFEGMRFGEATAALLSPVVGPTELENLDSKRLDAMQVDTARYGPMIGIGNDFYFAQGVFVSPRANLAVPLFVLATQSNLRWWSDVTLRAGVVF